MTAQVCAGGDARLGMIGGGGTSSRAWLASECLVSSRRCVYPVVVTDGGLPSRVVSELAPITLGLDEFMSDLSRYHAHCSCFNRLTTIDS